MTTYRLRSDRLREAAAARGDTTSYAICKRVGMAESTLSRLHRGLSRPSIGSLLKLSKTYGVPFEELVEQPEAAAGGSA